jgi:hypothetical protein
MSPTKKTPIHLGNQTFHLRYEHLSFVELEEKSGKNIQEHQLAMRTGSAVSLTWLIWAGLVHSDVQPGFREIAAMMKLAEYTRYAEAVAAALTIAMGPVEEGNTEGDN